METLPALRGFIFPLWEANKKVLPQYLFDPRIRWRGIGGWRAWSLPGEPKVMTPTVRKSQNFGSFSFCSFIFLFNLFFVSFASAFSGPFSARQNYWFTGDENHVIGTLSAP